MFLKLLPTIVYMATSLSACGGEPIPGDQAGGNSPSVDQRRVLLAASNSPKPVASLRLENGNMLEFFDFGSGALASESGAAYTAPMFNGQVKHTNQLVNIWKSLAPQTPVPVALDNLQARLMNLPENVARSAGTSKPATGGIEGIVPMSQNGCNNGCCDYAWLSTFSQCTVGGADYSWFLYNYGYTWSNVGNVNDYNGMVCSAQGTSQYSVNLGGSGGVWSVPEATYRTYGWLAGWSVWCFGFCNEDLSSTVNTSTSQHLHTYCGQVWH